MQEYRRRTSADTGPKINNNGYAYVDLGLPSGTLWARRNVGANSDTQIGDYYQAYSATKCTKYPQISQFYISQLYGNEIQYMIDNNITYEYVPVALPDNLNPVKVKMGGDWDMPTEEQIAELCNNCTAVRGGNGNPYVWTITSKRNGATMKIPGGGYMSRYGQTPGPPIPGSSYEANIYGKAGKIYITDSEINYGYGYEAVGIPRLYCSGNSIWYSTEDASNGMFDGTKAYNVRGVIKPQE